MRALAALLVFVSFAASAYDSRCRDTDPDCEGLEAARRNWVIVEHANRGRGPGRHVHVVGVEIVE